MLTQVFHHSQTIPCSPQDGRDSFSPSPGYCSDQSIASTASCRYGFDMLRDCAVLNKLEERLGRPVEPEELQAACQALRTANQSTPNVRDVLAHMRMHNPHHASANSTPSSSNKGQPMATVPEVCTPVMTPAASCNLDADAAGQQELQAPSHRTAHEDGLADLDTEGLGEEDRDTALDDDYGSEVEDAMGTYAFGFMPHLALYRCDEEGSTTQGTPSARSTLTACSDSTQQGGGRLTPLVPSLNLAPSRAPRISSSGTAGPGATAVPQVSHGVPVYSGVALWLVINHACSL